MELTFDYPKNMDYMDDQEKIKYLWDQLYLMNEKLNLLTSNASGNVIITSGDSNQGSGIPHNLSLLNDVVLVDENGQKIDVNYPVSLNGNVNFENGEQSKEAIFRFQNTAGTYPHNSYLYGGGPSSQAAIGTYDTLNSRLIWRYLDNTNTIEIGNASANIKLQNKTLSDFITEYGTIGNWIYRKFASGYQEAWYRCTGALGFNYSATTKYGDGFYIDNTAHTIDLPLQWSWTPEVIGNIRCAYGLWGISMRNVTEANNVCSLSYYIWSATNQTRTVYPDFYVYGKAK